MLDGDFQVEKGEQLLRLEELEEFDGHLPKVDETQTAWRTGEVAPGS